VKFEILNTEWAENLQQDYTEYMLACFESVEEDDHFATESDEVFCGCNVCEVREQLIYLTPRIIEAYEKGYIKLIGGDKDEAIES
jgi:hypothetical protein